MSSSRKPDHNQKTVSAVPPQGPDQQQGQRPNKPPGGGLEHNSALEALLQQEAARLTLTVSPESDRDDAFLARLLAVPRQVPQERGDDLPASVHSPGRQGHTDPYSPLPSIASLVGLVLAGVRAMGRFLYGRQGLMGQAAAVFVLACGYVVGAATGPVDPSGPTDAAWLEDLDQVTALAFDEDEALGLLPLSELSSDLSTQEGGSS